MNSVGILSTSERCSGIAFGYNSGETKVRWGSDRDYLAIGGIQDIKKLKFNGKHGADIDSLGAIIDE